MPESETTTAMPTTQRTLLTVEARAPKARRVKLADVMLEPDARRDGALVSSIRRVGLLEPPVLVEVAEGRLKVIAGRRRVAALKQIAKEDGKEDTATVEAKVFDAGTLSAAEMAGLLLTENGNRSENPLVEMRAVLALLRDGFTRAEIAASLNQSSAWVKRREGLAGLHPRLQKELRERRLTFGNALRMAAMPTPEQEQIVDELLQRREADPRARASDHAIRAAREVGPDLSAALFTRPPSGATPVPAAVLEDDAADRSAAHVVAALEASPAGQTFAQSLRAFQQSAEALHLLATQRAAASTHNAQRWNALVRHVKVAEERLRAAADAADVLEGFERRREEREGVTDAT